MHAVCRLAPCSSTKFCAAHSKPIRHFEEHASAHVMGEITESTCQAIRQIYAEQEKRGDTRARWSCVKFCDCDFPMTSIVLSCALACTSTVVNGEFVCIEHARQCKYMRGRRAEYQSVKVNVPLHAHLLAAENARCVSSGGDRKHMHEIVSPCGCRNGLCMCLLWRIERERNLNRSLMMIGPTENTEF